MAFMNATTGPRSSWAYSGIWNATIGPYPIVMFIKHCYSLFKNK